MSQTLSVPFAGDNVRIVLPKGYIVCTRILEGGGIEITIQPP